MRFYYLALLTWIAEILMFASIIFIPVVLFLRNKYLWFIRPFEEAECSRLHGHLV